MYILVFGYLLPSMIIFLGWRYSSRIAGWKEKVWLEDFRCIGFHLSPEQVDQSFAISLEFPSASTLTDTECV